MKWKIVSSLLVFTVLLNGEDLVHPEHLEMSLEEAWKEFQRAEDMFAPWYTGPILAPSAEIPKPGHVALQPYLFYINTYGRFDEHGTSHDIPNIQTWNPVVVMVAGLTERMAFQINAQYVHNSQEDRHGGHIGDTTISLNFPLIEETPYKPGVLIAFRENIPTGKFDNLDPDKGGMDATGIGAFQTSISLNFAKVFWWHHKHPMRARLSFLWNIPTHVDVRNFNAYGGGFGTDGKVHLNSGYLVDFGYEFSITQQWALALDVVYNYNGERTFSGNPGFSAPCQEANVGGPFGEQLSLAPAIEYNVSPNLGFIGGVWFTVWGKNAGNFASGVLSCSMYF